MSSVDWAGSGPGMVMDIMKEKPYDNLIISYK